MKSFKLFITSAMLTCWLVPTPTNAVPIRGIDRALRAFENKCATVGKDAAIGALAGGIILGAGSCLEAMGKYSALERASNACLWEDLAWRVTANLAFDKARHAVPAGCIIGLLLGGIYGLVTVLRDNSSGTAKKA